MSGMASNLSRKQSPIRCRDRILTFQSDLIRELRARKDLFSRNWPNVIRCRGEESRPDLIRAGLKFLRHIKSS
jgi:hypothetical protein